MDNSTVRIHDLIEGDPSFHSNGCLQPGWHRFPFGRAAFLVFLAAATRARTNHFYHEVHGRYGVKPFSEIRAACFRSARISENLHTPGILNLA